MQKSWTICTNSRVVAETLEKKCDHSHEHVHVQSTGTKETENYTEPLVHHIHKAIAKAAAEESRTVSDVQQSSQQKATRHSPCTVASVAAPCVAIEEHPKTAAISSLESFPTPAFDAQKKQPVFAMAAQPTQPSTAGSADPMTATPSGVVGGEAVVPVAIPSDVTGGEAPSTTAV